MNTARERTGLYQYAHLTVRGRRGGRALSCSRVSAATQLRRPWAECQAHLPHLSARMPDRRGTELLHFNC